MSNSNPSVKIAGKTAKSRSKKTLSEKTAERINRGVDVFGLNRPKPANSTKKELPNKATVAAILKAVKDALTKPSKVTSTVQADGNVIVDTGVEIRIENSITGGFNYSLKRQATVIPGNRKSPLEAFLEGKSPLVGHNTAFDLPTILGQLRKGEGGEAPFPITFLPHAIPLHANAEKLRQRDADAEFDKHVERARALGILGVDFETPSCDQHAPVPASRKKKAKA